MTDAEVLAFLDEPGHLVRIGVVSPEGMPLVVPAWFVRVDDRLYVTPRAKATWRHHLDADQKACFTIDESVPPYRKVIAQGSVEILFRPGEDDEWRDLYRSIVVRYLDEPGATAYLESTRHLGRVLIAMPFALGTDGCTAWRMPGRGEDPRGIWAERYWDPV